MTYFKSLLTLLLLSLVVSQVCQGAEAIFKTGDGEWKFFDGSEAPEKWSAPEFDDAKWKSGTAPLGYGDDDLKQKISFGDNEDKKNISAYFRRSVDVAADKKAKHYVAHVVCDDGCVVYLNGKEAFRHNLPEKVEIKATTRAKTGISNQLERYKLSFLINGEKIQTGKNLIAVSVHQVDPRSSDMAFDMALTPITDEETLEKTKKVIERQQKFLKEFEKRYKERYKRRSRDRAGQMRRDIHN